METKKASVNSLRLSLDAVSLVIVGIFLALSVIFSGKIAEVSRLKMSLLAAGLLYTFTAWLVRQLPGWRIGTALHVAAVLLLFSYLFQAVAGLQHVVVEGWLDDQLVLLERSLTGSDLIVVLQRFIGPGLTEWMMFAYVAYVPLLPCIAFVCYRAGGQHATYDFLLNFALVNTICNLGFILFPVAGPLFHAPEKYTVPLHGGFFTWCGAWMHSNMHYAGGSLPSPHCAVGTIMMAMLYRYHRMLWRVSLPVFLTIYAATVYCRFHYVWDSIAGILVAVAVLRFTPVIVNAVIPVAQKPLLPSDLGRTQPT